MQGVNLQDEFLSLAMTLGYFGEIQLCNREVDEGRRSNSFMPSVASAESVRF